MNERYLTIIVYVLLTLAWGWLVVVYLRHRTTANRRDPLVASILAVMALDAFKNSLESVFFGTLWSARYGLIPAEWGAPLENPWVLPLPKFFSLAVAAVLLYRVAGRAIPVELADREQRREEETRLRQEQQANLSRVQESERRLQSLLSATTDLVLLWFQGPDGELVLEQLNPAAKHSFFVGDDAVGARARELVGTGFVEILTQAMTSKKPVRDDTAVVNTRHGPRILRTTAVPLLEEGGAVTRVASLSHDITDVTRAAEEEEQRTRLESLGLLAGGVAHDFNNLLAVVKADVDLAARAGADPAHLAHAGDAIARARELVEQLMATAGARVRQSETVDVGALVADTVRLLQPAASGKVKLTAQTQRASTTGDRAQLQQIVLNLVQNAIEAAAKAGGAGEVVASVSAAEGTVTLEVTDDGPGIPADVQARMFDPFFTTKKDGRGLGLSTVLGLAQAHGGTVVVSSEVGKGARFTVTFPRVPDKELSKPVPVAAPSAPPPPPAPAPAPSSIPPLNANALRVLLVDDDDLVRRASRRLLERLGHSVVDVSSGKAALAVQQPYDVAVVDVTMPDLDGPATLHRLREQRPGLPAVIVTGRGDVAVDGDVVLPKPFDHEALSVALQKALEKKTTA